MSTTIENRSFLANSLTAIKNYITEPKLTKEQKKFLIENIQKSEQEIKYFLSRYFHTGENGHYSLKDESLQEHMIRLIQINSIIDARNSEILEKYFEGRERSFLEDKDRKMYTLMSEYKARQRSTLNEEEQKAKALRFKYSGLEYMYHFELLERYFQDKNREDLSLEDQEVFDVIRKYSAERQIGQIMLFEKEDEAFNTWNIGSIADEYDYWDDDRKIFDQAVANYRTQKDKIKVTPSYYKISYEALKRERARLYEELETKEK